ncbi:efflux RND transporter periplasmic adaptor subunit [Aeromonas cavernicola]|uniref:Efflux transporter periplasmic adaptor subunit n=1 Tax=Aeromonas cavernicola TaxID=1006623 RepID=A0A2H9U4E7_9GAMM|nr:efflux RND transporter periplasmic adaptor subunit [Aeromonas cavernicola]PJG58923.1 efflux transporter periplasmic adaptor subunit [Aeromonas cavernicola]
MKIASKKSALILSAMAGAALIGWLLWPSAPPQALLTAAVTREDITQTVLASGALQAIEQVDVGAQVSGQVTRLAVEVGDIVKKGELLAEIDPLLAQSNLKTAEAELASNRAQHKIKQAQLKQNRLAWQRQLQMFKQDASSRAELERAEAELAVTRAELQNSQANIDSAVIRVERAQTELGYTKIVAPMDGTVIAIVTRQGQTLAASQTVPTLLKLADLDTMTVKAQISEADVGKVKAGMPVYFTLLGDPDTRYQGTLRAVELAPTNINDQSAESSSTSNAAVYYYGLFEVANPNHALRVAMTAQVTVVLGERKQVLTVPQTALGKQLGDNEYEVTLVTDGDQTEVRPIKTGMKDAIRIEVVSGLAEHDQIQLNHDASIVIDDEETLL